MSQTTCSLDTLAWVYGHGWAVPPWGGTDGAVTPVPFPALPGEQWDLV